MFALAIPALLALNHVSAAPAPQSAPQLQTAAHVMSLIEMGTEAPSSKALKAGLDLVKSGPLKSVEGGAGYGVSVDLGGQTFEVIFDTGSSDLWVFQEGAKCVDELGIPEPAKECGFGKEFTGSFDEGKISGENFFVEYGSGEELTGTVGYEKVTVAGLTVPKQEMGLVNKGYWQGDGSVSGIFGFARNSITSAYKGNNPSLDGPSNHVPYSSFIDTAISEKLIAPVFSVVLERKGGSSQVALGGLPTISFDHSFATTDIKKVQLQGGSSAYAYYAIETEGLVVGGKSLPAFEAVVDTGTTLLYLPKSLAAEVNKAFDPPSKTEEGLYVNSCNAKAPTLAVKVGGKEFKINPADLLISEPSTGLCVSGVQATSSGEPSILGDVFLHNVVAVFDIGKEQVQFAPHENY